jgi:uncharacterized SAM-binding protein YcdF (DUF218 family)
MILLPGPVKSALTPGSIPFFLLCVLIGLGLRYAWPRYRRIANWWLAGVFCVYGLLALPLLAGAIVDRLPQVPAGTVSPGQVIDTMIVIDGDNRVGRVETSVRIFRAADVRAILVLGDPWLIGELETAGVPGDRLEHDFGPSNTRGQIARIRRLMETQPGARVVLIASRLQMPRIAALARAERIAPLLVPSPIDSEPPTSGIWRFVPSYIALRASRDALYEYAALAFYRWQGWIAS